LKKKVKYLGRKNRIVTANGLIPLEKAAELCRIYRDTHKVRLFSQCWGYLRFSKEVPEKMCFYEPPKNNGCRFVNRLFEESNKK
jgi:hypothetical protein